MKIRHFLLSFVVLMSLWAFGCAPARSEIDYLTTGGKGEVRGSMSGVDFSAVVEISSGGSVLCVEYLSPSSLCGLILTAKGEECEVRFGDLEFFCKTDEVEGFLRPVTAFLPCDEASTVQKEGENTVLTYPSGGRLTLSPKGEPLSLTCDDIDVRVVWWEKGSAE